MIRKLLTFAFVFITNFVFCQSQEAILYFNDGTSIEGLGKIESSNPLASFSVEDKILFRLTEEDEADEWTYEDVKGITFIGFEMLIKLEYVKLNKFYKPRLLELVTDGNVRLYQKNKIVTYDSPAINPSISFNSNGGIGIGIAPGSFSSSTTNENKIYYLKRETEELATAIGVNYKKKTIAYFNDCEGLVKKIKNYEFTWENFDQLVDFYNDICSD